METQSIKQFPWAYLGIQPYPQVWQLQEDIRKEVLENRSFGKLLITQHPPTISLGRAEKGENVLVDLADLNRRGFVTIQSNRGGKVTYHGPGQLVAYPIFDLRPFKMGVKQYVHALEETMIRLLKKLGMEASRKEKCPGAWVGGKKIGSIGIHVRKQVPIHGIALNVAPNLSHFNVITPCGLSDIEMTSIEQEGTDISFEKIIPLFVTTFEEVFGCKLYV